jgi:hypothetical protein
MLQKPPLINENAPLAVLPVPPPINAYIPEFVLPEPPVIFLIVAVVAENVLALKPPVKFVAPDTVPPVNVPPPEDGRLTYVVADMVVADIVVDIILFV